MDSLDIQIAVYVEDKQLLFDAALTLDSINLYTRETPDIISFDTKEITDGISRIENEIKNTSKESTLIAKIAELKEALNTIDFTAIEQAIHNVEDVTAKEATLLQGVGDIIRVVENIDFTDLENSIAEVKNAVVNIDFSTLAKEITLTQGIASISQKVDNIVIPEVDTTPLAKEATLTHGVNVISQKIDNIKLPEIDTTELAKESTLNAVSSKLDNMGLSAVGEVIEAINKVLPTLSTELTQGKDAIVDAILAAGISADNTEDLVQLAKKVRQSINIQTHGIVPEDVLPISLGQLLCGGWDSITEINDSSITTISNINAINNMSNLKRLIVNGCTFLTKGLINDSVEYIAGQNITEIPLQASPAAAIKAGSLKCLYLPSYSIIDSMSLFQQSANQNGVQPLRHLVLYNLASTGRLGYYFRGYNLYHLEFVGKLSLSRNLSDKWQPTYCLDSVYTTLIDADEWDDPNQPIFNNNQEKFLWYFEYKFIPSIAPVTSNQTLTLYSGIYDLISSSNSQDTPEKTLKQLIEDKGWTIASA